MLTPGSDLTHFSEKKLQQLLLSDDGFVLQFEDGIKLEACCVVRFEMADGETHHYNRYICAEVTPRILEPLVSLLERRVAIARWVSGGTLVLEFYTGERIEIE